MTLDRNARPHVRPSYAAALAAITAAGGLLRLAFIERQSLGYDEDFTAVVAHQSVGRIIEIASRDSAPPLFYLLERAVAAAADLAGLGALGGPGGPAVLRLAPAIAGIALIPIIAALARRVAGDTAALWAALFVAFVPATVALSGFARMYGPAATLTAAAALLMWRAIEQPRAGRWALYVAAGAAAVWLDYFAAVALAGIFLAAIYLRPARGVAVTAFVATAAAAGSIAPWLIVARAQFEHAGQGFWVEPLGPSQAAGTFAQFIAGPPIATGVAGSPALIALQCVAIAAAGVIAAAAAVSWRGLTPVTRRAVTYCLLCVSGVAMIAAVSVWRPLLEARYLAVMWFPLMALAGVGLAAMPRKIAAALIVAVAIPSLALSAVQTHAGTSALVPIIDASVGPHDLVAVDQNHYMILLDEGGPVLRERLRVLAVVDPPWFAGTAAYAPGAVIHVVPADVAAAGGEIFWVADPGAPLPSLPAGYGPTTTRCDILVCLTVYAPLR